MDLIIIACCKTKNPDGFSDYYPSPLAGCMGDASFKKLMSARKELAGILDLPSGPDLGFQNNHTSVKYMPAYQRYKGKIYERSDFENTFPKLALN